MGPRRAPSAPAQHTPTDGTTEPRLSWRRRAALRPPARRLAAALSGAALLVASMLVVTVLEAPPSAAVGEAPGWWPTSFKAHETAADCGRWKLDKNGFCVANDARNGLEVGVKFRTSRRIQITGIRIYRFDPATLTGSLWAASGKLLARGQFAPGPASAWQDMTFQAPVEIVPGRTYIASYFTPGTKYAFRYQYFAHSGHTVGPVTALRSTDAEPNGVHCYENTRCGSFPTHGYRSSTYWVTPLWRDSAVTTSNDSRATARPRVLRVTPHADAAKTTSKVRITFSEAMSPSTLTSSSVRLLHRHKRVATRATYHPGSHRLVLKPRHRLRAGATYRTEVTTHVRDAEGHRLDQNAAKPHLQKGVWGFHTR